MLPNFSFYRRIILLLAMIVPLTGCLFRTRKVERQLSTAPLKSATQAELIAVLGDLAGKIQSMQATVDIDTSVGDAQNARVTDYKEIRGYVLARKPSMLRMIGLLPVVRNKAFDMVSDGDTFKVWIPPRNKFVMGKNGMETTTPQRRFEDLRPQNIYDALLIREVSPTEVAVLENGFETVLDARRHRVDQPDYELDIIAKGEHGWYLSRKIQFSRTDLLPHRQWIYSTQGRVTTDVKYDNYQDYGGTQFPSKIEIQRPIEDYDVTLFMVKLELNRKLTDDQFQLDQPPNAEVQRLDQPKPPDAVAPAK